MDLNQLLKVAAICLALLVLSPQSGRATESVPAAAPPAVSVPELDRSIEQTLAKREFSWRLPREKQAPVESKNWFVTMIDDLWKSVENAARAVRDWVRDVFDWLEKFFKPKTRTQKSHETSTGWMTSLQVMVFILLALVASAVAILFYRVWKNRRAPKEVVLAEAIAAQPDLADENVVADQLPEDGWMRLARELLEKGDLRLALRAFYLAGLAHLAQREMVTIAKFKSNRDYEMELRRRARSLPDLQTAFAQNVITFDRVWYGRHDVTPDSLQDFQVNLERIRTC